MIESFNNITSQNTEGTRTNTEKIKYDPDDYTDTLYYRTLIQLPAELAQTHLEQIDAQGLSDEDALKYLTEIVNKRKEAITITVVSDEKFRELLTTADRNFFNQVETTVYESPSIGAGMTAKVKRFELSSETESIQVAIKYLLTPTSRTISAAEEHNVLREVERIKTIEDMEREAHIDLIRVPHPYFHHKSERIQCYGMELIDGANLREIIDGEVSEEMYKKLFDSLSEVSEDTLYEQVEAFFAEMHRYCLHGDVKPANIMMSTEGKFYVIDFGQSVLVSNIPEKGRKGLDDRRDEEVERTKISIKRALRKLHLQNEQMQLEAA